MCKKYSVEEKKKVVSLFFDGIPVSQLTSDTGIPKSTIYRWIRESKAEEGNSSIYSPLNYYMLEKKYKKLQSIIEILQKVNCKPTDPLSIKLPEMESLYGQYSVHTLCEALCVSRGTFYNPVLRRKSSGKWYEIRREEFRERIRQIYDESNQVLGPKRYALSWRIRGIPPLSDLSES